MTGRLSAFQIMALRNLVMAVLVVILVAVVQPSAIRFDIPRWTMFLMLSSAVIVVLGDVAFMRAIAIEDVSRVFTVTNSLYIIMSVAGSILFRDEAFSWGLAAGGLAVLVGASLVVGKEATPSAETTRRRQPLFALWLSIVAALLWSASLLAVSGALDEVSALTAAALRTPFEAACLLGFVLIRGDLRSRPTSRGDLRTLFVSGLLSLGSMLLFLYAVDQTSAGVVAVLSSTSPIFAVPLAFFLLKERVTQRVAIGICTCMAGIWLTMV